MGPRPWGELGGGAEAEYGHVAYLLKAEDLQQHGSKYFSHRHTLDPGGGVKMSNHIFCESSQVAYQIEGN